VIADPATLLRVPTVDVAVLRLIQPYGPVDLARASGDRYEDAPGPKNMSSSSPRHVRDRDASSRNPVPDSVRIRPRDRSELFQVSGDFPKRRA